MVQDLNIDLQLLGQILLAVVLAGEHIIQLGLETDILLDFFSTHVHFHHFGQVFSQFLFQMTLFFLIAHSLLIFVDFDLHDLDLRDIGLLFDLFFDLRHIAFMFFIDFDLVFQELRLVRFFLVLVLQGIEFLLIFFLLHFDHELGLPFLLVQSLFHLQNLVIRFVLDLVELGLEFEVLLVRVADEFLLGVSPVKFLDFCRIFLQFLITE